MFAKDIFLLAIEIESAADRTAFIAEKCAGDPQLQRLVAALLAAHDDPESYLERPAARFAIDATTVDGGKDSAYSDSSSSHHGRFIPGTRVAGRYRIVSLLGRGGMGEVYRADDLRLGQTVALKFLPAELAQNAKRLEYFHNEVKLARQISHPNVCRVYDIGEVDGQHFISMEYIDGEDLKTLLHRIGRLPKDKGIQIAQQLCSGLSAAHNKGVLHRDLKPANIMIDGQGQVRITDFGLATISASGENVVGMSGTPAYMAPEQLLRGEAGVRTDIYSLGLILFEVFSGREVHTARSLQELQKIHEDSSAPRNLSEVIEDCDPIVDRAVRRCLESDPQDRPSSVAELAASLPGGNALAAAIRAGEIPSPDLVAASEDTHGVSRKVLVVLGIAGLLGLLAIPALCGQTSLIQKVSAERPPAVLEADAKQVIRQLGYTSPPMDSAYGFDEQIQQIRQSLRLRQTQGKPRRFPAIRFWYRQHEGVLFQKDFWSELGHLARSRVWSSSPEWNEPGMIGVQLDTKGKLLQFRAVPAIKKWSAPAAVSELDWDALFSEDLTGFRLTELSPATWQRTPPGAYDELKTWEGVWPNSDEPLLVEAAAYRGRLVYFEVFQKEELVRNVSPSVRAPLAGNAVFILAFTFIALAAVGVVTGISNVNRGRIDRRGVVRLMLAVLALDFFGSLCLTNHVPFPYFETQHLITNAAVSLMLAAVCGLLYTAIEPLARRTWPQLLISWSRLIKGQFLDPVVGRDLFLGTLAAILVVAYVGGASRLFGVTIVTDPLELLGPRELTGRVAIEMAAQIMYSLGVLFILTFTRRLTGSVVAAALVTTVIGACGVNVILFLPTVAIIGTSIFVGATIMLTIRFGFLFYAVYLVTVNCMAFPYTYDTNKFFAETGFFCLFLVALQGTVGFLIAGSGRKR